MSVYYSLELVRAHEAAARRRLGVRSDREAALLAVAGGAAAGAAPRVVLAHAVRVIAHRLDRVAARLERWGDLPSATESPLAGR